MEVSRLLAWQWSGYTKYHVVRTNLLLHIVAVPFFLLGNVTLVVGLLGLAPVLVIIGALTMGLSLAVQGRGHKMESIPAEPFTGLANALARLLLEQWVTFPRFVLSGGWLRALHHAG